MSYRLARARDLLPSPRQPGRGSFVRGARGVLAHEAAAAVPSSLIQSLANAASSYAASPLTTSAMPAAVILAEGAIQSMWYSQLKWAATVALGLAVLLTGAGLAMRHLMAERVPVEAVPIEPKDPPADAALSRISLASLYLTDAWWAHI